MRTLKTQHISQAAYEISPFTLTQVDLRIGRNHPGEHVDE